MTIPDAIVAVSSLAFSALIIHIIHIVYRR